jgi:hypothetical protein
MIKQQPNQPNFAGAATNILAPPNILSTLGHAKVYSFYFDRDRSFLGLTRDFAEQIRNTKF